MPDDLQKRLDSIDWANYESACGFDSTEIPPLVIELNGINHETSMKAIDRLWNVVCHQSNVGSNSVPVLPFLIERLQSASPELQSEILDIIYPFACHARMCSKRQHGLLVDWGELIDEELAQAESAAKSIE